MGVTIDRKLENVLLSSPILSASLGSVPQDRLVDMITTQFVELGDVSIGDRPQNDNYEIKSVTPVEWLNNGVPMAVVDEQLVDVVLPVPINWMDNVVEQVDKVKLSSNSFIIPDMSE